MQYVTKIGIPVRERRTKRQISNNELRSYLCSYERIESGFATALPVREHNTTLHAQSLTIGCNDELVSAYTAWLDSSSASERAEIDIHYLGETAENVRSYRRVWNGS
jgi:hypothetical protein